MSKPDAAAPSPAKRNRTFLMISVVALVVIAALAGAEIIIFDAHPTHYACVSIAYQGSTVDLTTTGLIHISGSQYYISCNEGSDEEVGGLPGGSLNTSCVTITGKEITFPYPAAAPTEYYYITAPGHTITLLGAPANETEIYQPNNASIQVDCS